MGNYNKKYAVEHGESRFNGKYKLLEKEVKASDIFTDGNSIHEQGYSPKDDRFEAPVDKVSREANFKEWFKGSVVADDAGEPMVMYHGTKGDFEEFSKSKGSSASRAKDGKEGFFFSPDSKIAAEYSEFANNKNWAKYEKALDDWKKKDITFEEFKKTEEWFSKLSIEETKRTGITNQNIMPVYLDMKNPKIISHMKQYNEEAFKFEIPYAKEQGYDGVIFKNIEDRVSAGEWKGANDTYVVFEPNQIKSVNNKGTFSKETQILFIQTIQ